MSAYFYIPRELHRAITKLMNGESRKSKDINLDVDLQLRFELAVRAFPDEFSWNQEEHAYVVPPRFHQVLSIMDSLIRHDGLEREVYELRRKLAVLKEAKAVLEEK